MGGDHNSYMADMSSRYRRDNDRRRQVPAVPDEKVRATRRETSLTRETDADLPMTPMTSDMTPAAWPCFMRW